VAQLPLPAPARAGVGGGTALFDGGVQEEVGAIKAWAERTGDGSLADLPTPPRAEVWDEVSAEPDLCTRTKCPHYSACFSTRRGARPRRRT
jgi:ATP-dependent DNA helicase DinG